MKLSISTLVLLFFASSSTTNAQCHLDFGTAMAPPQFTFSKVNSTDIVNGSSSGANDSSTQSFDIWDEGTNDCSFGGGLEDITFEFEIVHAFDQYGVDGIIDAFAGATHDIVQSSSGIAGGIPLGNSSTNETSTGDVRGYTIKVTFADHVEILAQDLIVDFTSVNTAGGGHESSSLVFLDESNMPYGTATYEGYYEGTTGASTDNSCTTPAVRANSWSVSATGAYTASSTANIDLTDPCNTSAGSNGPNDNHDVSPVTDAGLNATDQIGGFIFTVYLEDVAASSAPGAETTTSTRMTSTLNGISITTAALPVELVAFEAVKEEQEVAIHWSTASEENNDYFDLQWSTDGERFESIGTIAGAGTNSEINSYKYLHASPANGNNYYRLKQVDYNGSFSYSHTQLVRFKNEETVSIYPTLVSEVLYVDQVQEDATISIFNSNGLLVRNINVRSGTLEEVDVSDLMVGAYFVAVGTEREMSYNRFVKR